MRKKNNILEFTPPNSYDDYDAFHDSIIFDKIVAEFKENLKNIKDLKEAQEMLDFISKYENTSDLYL